jgi:hypothetical protein
VLGGRGDALDTQTRVILAIDPATGAFRRAGRLPAPTSDTAAVVVRGRILVFGGRSGSGTTSDRIVAVTPG